MSLRHLLGFATVDLRELQRHWDRFGTEDPLWAILTVPGTRHHRWRRAEFFRSGEEEIERVLSHVDAMAARCGQSFGRGRALDFGCGVGRVTQALAARFDCCDGVDLAPSMTELAREWNQYGERCRYHVNSSDHLCLFADGSFDFIYSAHVLQHMQPRYSRRYVEEFVRVLAPNGLAVVEMTTEPVTGANAPLPDTAFRAVVRIRSCARQMLPGGRYAVWVEVTNRSSYPWPAAGKDGWFLVDVGNHWLGRAGRTVINDDARTPLPHDVRPGETVLVELHVTAPSSPGRYNLEVDLVQEGVAWFADQGSTTTATRVHVRQPRPWLAWRRAGREVVAAVEWDEPRMEMYGVPEAEFVGWVCSAGGRVLEVLNWDDLFGTRSYDWVRRCFLIVRA